MKTVQNFLLCVYVMMSFSFVLGIADDNNLPEKSMVIIIPSYNNKEHYVHNLQSILSQNYTNFRVIYTDDCSPDGTGRLVEEYLIDNDPDGKVYLIKNSVRRGSLYNLFTMVHMCDDDEIIVTVDGDDWLKDDDKNILKRINAVYSSGEIWMTYGQFQWLAGPSGWSVAYADEIVKNNTFRWTAAIPTQLRTFYAWLFKKIKLNDLLYMGRFYPMAGDVAFIVPIIEMAGERHKFIPDIAYVYNDGTALNDHARSRQLQMHMAQILSRKERYSRLAYKPIKKYKESEIKADAILFSQSPEKLLKILDSFKTYVDGIDKIFVIFKPESSQEIDDYNALRSLYPEINFYIIDEQGSNFHNILLSVYCKINNDYVLFAKGDAMFQKSLCLSECINALEDTSANAFYFKLNAQEGMRSYQTLPLIQLKNDMYAWNFALAFDSDRWSSANSIDLVLHRNENIFSFILQNNYKPTPNGLECSWAGEGRLDRVGLCFGENHVVEIS
jgi:glycosyltransferase involved in cell wall biosynthesis